MKKRLLPITVLSALGLAALAGCGGSGGGGGGGGGGGETVVDVTGVSLNKSVLSLEKGQTETLVETVLPTNATDKSVTWTSSMSAVASVAHGVVTAKEVGRAVITVKTTDGGFEAKCNVTVPMEVTSLEITNKADFAEPIEAGQNKALSFTIDPASNVDLLIQRGALVITSGNEDVATISGKNVYAKAAGTTTITADLFGKTDSFELTVFAKQTNKEKFGTTHEGDAKDPFDNEDAIKVTKALKESGEASGDYYVKGEILSFYHAPGARTDGAVSWFLKPATEGGEKFEVYKCYKEGKGEETWLTDDDVWVGGTAVAHGLFTYYESGKQCETDGAAVFVSCEGNKPEPRKTINSTVADALAAGALLADGADSYDYYKFDAFVTVKEGDNYFLTASKGEELVKAKSDAQHGERDYYSNAIEVYNGKAVADLLLKDAKITVTMILKNYHGQVENLLALATTDIVVVEAGGPWVEPEPEKITVAQAIAKINAIDISGVTADKTSLYVVDEKGAQLKFEVSGVIVKVGSWNSQYGNGDAYMQDEAGYDADKALQLFRINDKAVFDKLVADETQVSVVCTLCAYVRVNEGVPSIGARETGANPVVTIKGDVPPQPEPEKITVAQALEKINALDYSGVTKNNTNLFVKDESGKELEFEVSGIITKVGSWNSQYGNGDAYMQDEAGYDADKALQLFRINDKEVFDKLVADETEVSVVCKLVLFVKLDGENKPYVAGRETNANPVVTVSGGGGGGSGSDPIVLNSANLLGYVDKDVSYNATESSVTIGGISYSFIQLGAYKSENGALRMRTKDGQGSYLFNTVAFDNAITSIDIKLSSAKSVYDNTDVWSFTFGTSASELGNQVKVSTVKDQLEYSVTATGSPTFFRIDKIITSYTFYIESITINF